jgi:TPP-dependent pyruvate/acetoin dehydrogenase alpha subunit
MSVRDFEGLIMIDPKEMMIQMYRRMLLSRLFEERLIEMYRRGLRGLYHLSIGQEAVAVGVCSALHQEDTILSTHRAKGHYIAKGGDLKALMAEFMEKKTGCNKGKGGPMHIIDPSVGMFGANGIVGSTLPIACGVALAAKIRGTGRVAACFFGDGAANSGPCHESMNLAGLWKLPLLFVCENNSYQVSVPSPRHSSIQDFYLRADGYGFPGILVDGMDVGAVYEAARGAVERARAGHGPTLLECKTYRFRGHSEADPTRGLSYRSEEEVKSWEEKCPLRRVQRLLREKGWVSEDGLHAIEEQCRDEIDKAIAFAEESPPAPPEWSLLDVFAEA